MKKTTNQTKKTKSFQAEHEEIIVKNKLKDFDISKSRAWARLTEKFGPKVSQEELLSLARVVAYHCNIDLFREYQRRKKMLIRWFDDNYDEVFEFIDKYIIVTDNEDQKIDFTVNQSEPTQKIEQNVSSTNQKTE